jgi:uncharacterized membrane protein
MTQTVAPAPLDEARFHQRPATDGQALRDIHTEVHELHHKVQEIKECPQEHHPKLVLSEHVRGSSILDKIADGVNLFCGSMYVFLFITVGIVAWLILGPVIGFDEVPWPLLLTILNLPQLSIMVSLQVSANRAQAASHDMPGRQEQIQETVGAILAAVRGSGGATPAGGALPAS